MKTILTILITALWASTASAVVEGSLFQWQMDNYSWTKEEFPQEFEKGAAPNEEVKGKSAEEIYHWQLEDKQWTTEEFDIDSKEAR